MNERHTRPRAEFADPADGPARTTAALVGSLRERLAALRAMSGADAVGSLVAGYAQVGREAAKTAQGARLAAALRAGRPGANGEAVWSALGVDELTRVPSSPVLDHLRNDLALLLADDIDGALRAPASPQPPSRADDRGTETAPADSVDYLVGMWAFSRELVAVVEALAAPTALAQDVRKPAHAPTPDEPLLR